MLLFNPDNNPHPDGIPFVVVDGLLRRVEPLTVDRIIPGCKGGTYRRDNIRPACGGCNSETGGALAGKGKKP